MDSENSRRRRSDVPPPGAYTPGDKAGNADGFARFKWVWLDQVCQDSELPPMAFKLTYVVASKFLNRKNGKAWPSQATLASELGISDRQVQSLTAALRDRAHWTTRMGGKGKSNIYTPTLHDPQYPAGHAGALIRSRQHLNPKKNDALTRRKLPTTLSDEPTLEPRAGLQPAPARQSATAEVVRKDSSAPSNVGRASGARIGAPDLNHAGAGDLHQPLARVKDNEPSEADAAEEFDEFDEFDNWE